MDALEWNAVKKVVEENPKARTDTSELALGVHQRRVGGIETGRLVGGAKEIVQPAKMPSKLRKFLSSLNLRNRTKAYAKHSTLSGKGRGL